MNDEIPIRVMESDTPETNAKERPIWPPNTNGEMFMVPSDFARKLERERDEAREKFDNEATEHMLAVNKLCGERDEAIEKYRFAVIHWQIDVAKMERERDEARAEAKKLDGAYEDATNYYARWSELIEERDEAREELKQLKEKYGR